MSWPRFISEMPSTNARLFVSLVLFAVIGLAVVVTGVGRDPYCATVGVEAGLQALPVCVSRGWQPSYEFMGFITLWGGLDVAQFWAKRKTNQPDAPELPPGTEVRSATSVSVPAAGPVKPIDEVRPP